MKIKKMGCVLALVLGSSAANAGVTLFDNLTGQIEDGASGVSPGYIASSFSTGSFCSTGCTLGNITLRMFIEADTNINDISLGLYSDAGTTFGSLITTLINPTSINDSFEDAVFTAQNLTTLSANTIYWVHLSAAPGSDGGEWGRSFTSNVSGNFDINGTHRGGNSPFLYKVEAEVSNVPVPASVWLMVTALTGLVARTRKTIA